MQTKHYLLIGAALTSLGTMVGSLPSWDAITPLFVGGLLGSLGSTITALYMQRPNEP